MGLSGPDSCSVTSGGWVVVCVEVGVGSSVGPCTVARRDQAQRDQRQHHSEAARLHAIPSSKSPWGRGRSGVPSNALRRDLVHQHHTISFPAKGPGQMVRRSGEEQGMAARITTTDRVFASLRESILSGEFPAGSLHSIYRLADLLDVSRTPVREAVLRLADIGLVTIERNRGVRIRGVSVADVRAVFELRLMIEVPAAAYAAAHAAMPRMQQLEAELEAMRSARRSAATSHDSPPTTGRSTTRSAPSSATRGRSTRSPPCGTRSRRVAPRRCTARVAWRRSSASTCRSSRRSRRGTPRRPRRAWRSTSSTPAALLMAQAATPDDPAPGPGWADRLRDHLYVPGRAASPPE